MALRAGELMVVIRAQDFASRTMRRVGAEFAGLSREQALFRRQAQLAIKEAEKIKQIETMTGRLRDLKTLERYAKAQKHFTNQAAAVNSAITRQNRLYDANLQRLDAIARHGRDPLTGSFASSRLAREGIKEIEARMASFRSGLETELGVTQRVLNRLGDTIANKLPSDMQRFKRAADMNANRALIDIERETARTASTLRRLHPELAFIRDDLQVVNTAIRQIPIERMDRMAHALSGLGRTAQLFGAVGTAAFGFAANAAAQFNTEMSLAGTQARNIGAGFGQVRTRVDQMTHGFMVNGKEISGVLDLMNKYPATSQEMSAATYDIFSSMNLERNGIIDVAKGLQLLEDANKIAVAGGGTLEEATQAMITVLNNFDPQLQNTTEQFDTMFDIVRFGRMRLSEFNIMMNKIAPAAADAGNTLEDVGGAMAFLTTVMPSQRMVATGISRLLEALRHPDVVKGLKMFGVEAKDATGKLRPLDKLIVDIADHFPALRTGQMSAADFFREVSAAGRGGKSKGVIFTQEGRRALSQIVTHLDQYLQRQNQIERNTDEFNQSLKAQQQALGVQWDVFQNRLRAIAIQIGTDAIPAFAEIGDVISKLVDAWNNLDPAMRQTIVRMAVFGSVGTVLAGVGAAILGSFLALEAMMRRMGITGGGLMTTFRSMLMILRRLSAIATIAIAIDVMRKGDADAWQILMGMISGAVVGSRFGIFGALAGGLVIPITILASKSKGSLAEDFTDTVRGEAQHFRDIAKTANPALKKYNLLLARHADYLANAADGYKGSDIAFAKYRSNLMDVKEFERWERTVKRIDAVEESHTRNMKGRTKEEKDAAEKAAAARVAAFKKYRAAMKVYNDKLAEFEDNTRQYKEDLKRWHEDLADTTRQARVDAVDNLRNMYQEMEQVNRQAFGELFKGPWLTSETFDLAQEWGITPRIQDMIKDLRMQNNAFAKWRADLDKIMKRGLPKEFIDEIRGMGIEQGQPFIEQILKASPQQVNNLIAQYKRREGQIKSATKMDFVDEIERFRKAGGDMGSAIIDGFKEAQVGMWFDGWIKSTFPDVINSAVNEAVRRWKQQTPAPTAPTPPVRPVMPAGATARNPGGVATIPAAPRGPFNPVTTNNTVNVGIHDADIGGVERFKFREEALRQAAFVARNAFRGAFK
jgi:TP901 family phage tail tape measure protein